MFTVQIKQQIGYISEQLVFFTIRSWFWDRTVFLLRHEKLLGLNWTVSLLNVWTKSSFSYEPEVSLSVKHHGQIFLSHDRNGPNETKKNSRLWIRGSTVTRSSVAKGSAPKQGIWLDNKPWNSPFDGGGRYRGSGAKQKKKKKTILKTEMQSDYEYTIKKNM